MLNIQWITITYLVHNIQLIIMAGCLQLLHHHHHHQSLNREGCWGTTDNFATSFLHFSLFSTALWDLLNSRSVHFPDVVFPPLPLSALSSSPFTVLCLARWFWPDLMNGKHDHTTAVCLEVFMWSNCLLDLIYSCNRNTFFPSNLSSTSPAMLTCSLSTKKGNTVGSWHYIHLCHTYWTCSWQHRHRLPDIK